MLEFLGILVILYLAWCIIPVTVFIIYGMIYEARQAKHRRVVAELQASIDRQTKATFI